MKLIFLMTVALLTVMTGCAGTRDVNESVNRITPGETAKILGRDTAYVILDVRTFAEFTSETGHLQGAILIPVDSLSARLNELTPYKSKTVIAYCRSGVRSGRAEKILNEHGFRALSMSGGITRWNIEQLPVVKEQK